MAILKQSTAYVRLFLMVLTSDHISGATGKNGSLVVKLSKNGATGVTAAGTTAEVDSTNLPGVYSISLTNVDTNTNGDLAYNCTATGCDATTFVDQVQTTIFTDLAITGAGRAFLNSGVTKNATLALPFVMTVAGVPTAGLAVTGQRNFGAGWSNIAGAITDLTLGSYLASLTAADTNSASAMYRFTATNADDRDIALQFDP